MGYRQCRWAICAASNRRPRHTAAARRAGGETLPPAFFVARSAKQAHDHAREEISRHRLPRGDWRIYVVGASFRDLAQPAGGNAYVCMRMAPLADGLSAMPVAICAASNRRPRHAAAARRAGGETLPPAFLSLAAPNRPTTMREKKSAVTACRRATGASIASMW
ncbi:DVU_2496 family lipoprotein [uncultured Desulfovibrio sp.]|uniref:DVU_2496 family lipoprotein n=1 Tax=uncultured Desulfovibrio sp. TaxID=167968 RepID=UPI0034502D0E